MVFNTGNFTYEDIKDKSISEGGGFGLSTSTWNLAQPTKINAKGRTKISIQDNGHIVEGYTKATLGQGQINIGGIAGYNNNLLAGVNRDISDVQKITRDQMTGALDLEIIIDHRWFSQEGRDEMNPVRGYKKRQEAVDKMFGEAIDDTELTMGINNDEKKYMGRMTEDPITGEVSVDTSGMPWYEKMTYDDNPIFGFIYNYFPGAKAATLYHDYEYDKRNNLDQHGEPQDHKSLDLMLSIPGSFMGTWYSTIFGKPFSNTGNKK
jgi:hypothetical protein